MSTDDDDDGGVVEETIDVRADLDDVEAELLRLQSPVLTQRLVEAHRKTATTTISSGLCSISPKACTFRNNIATKEVKYSSRCRFLDHNQYSIVLAVLNPASTLLKQYIGRSHSSSLLSTA